MNPGVLFAIIAAFSFGLWTVFHQLASKHINPILGAIVVSLTAVVVGVVVLFIKSGSESLVTSPKGWIFVILAGICALLIDIFVLKAYNSGLSISVGGPIIIGGSIAIASIIGFVLGDSISFLKITGILLTIIGAAILASFA